MSLGQMEKTLTQAVYANITRYHIPATLLNARSLARRLWKWYPGENVYIAAMVAARAVRRDERRKQKNFDRAVASR